MDKIKDLTSWVSEADCKFNAINEKLESNTHECKADNLIVELDKINEKLENSTHECKADELIVEVDKINGKISNIEVINNTSNQQINNYITNINTKIQNQTSLFDAKIIDIEKSFNNSLNNKVNELDKKIIKPVPVNKSKIATRRRRNPVVVKSKSKK